MNKLNKMKRNTTLALSFALLAAIGSSCAKSTKGKLANDWKMSSLEGKEAGKNITGDQWIFRTVMNENTINLTNEFYPVNDSVETSYSSGIVNAYHFTIRKDGTWSRYREFVFPNSTGSSTEITEESGTWSFVSKTKGDNFKKRERVLFNVLESSETRTQVLNQEVVTDYTEHASYISGEKMMIYTIVSSSKKQLELEMEAKMDYASGSQTGMTSSSEKIIFSGK